MRHLFPALLLACCLASPALLADEQMDPEVVFLLDFVADSGCDFVRNGSLNCLLGSCSLLCLRIWRREENEYEQQAKAYSHLDIHIRHLFLFSRRDQNDHRISR